MVSQLKKISPVNPVKPDFNYIKDVYEVCLEKYLANPKTVSSALRLIDHGRKILQYNEEVDTYIAFYGAQHYYKLIEAFNALDMSIFRDQKLEIISYGCGAATDACSLISYCRSKQINLPFNALILIEPSQIALERGIQYINQALYLEESKKIKINKVNKSLESLEENDIFSNSKITKLHVFSNILDLQEINLQKLVSLLKNTQVETNYFICISPKNYNGNQRIDTFYQNMSSAFNLSTISTNNFNFKQRVWSMKNNRYVDDYSIDRYHKIFTAQIN
ncbi:hypothetical protein C7B62_15235 [Pleurocapsa sp. CCALA 161]|uniref:hypothetical protein n=1 Tax=Pleurocapsa sp. CCALA 161 TaxID=2107688 RepID=UPI000D050599|nr:hypothetical protein [Pleurocapsa sp. CCALA 161]PSB08858.1 hypothetical protein C7B62_15235 [Pleurocapsa sp. CCALA 161]